MRLLRLLPEVLLLLLRLLSEALLLLLSSIVEGLSGRLLWLVVPPVLVVVSVVIVIVAAIVPAIVPVVIAIVVPIVVGLVVGPVVLRPGSRLLREGRECGNLGGLSLLLVGEDSSGLEGPVPGAAEGTGTRIASVAGLTGRKGKFSECWSRKLSRRLPGFFVQLIRFIDWIRH